jgi:heme a synthase
VSNLTIPNTDCFRWPRRFALLTACITFPLIWVGGLVTTQDAGMAVPDWPSTYGYNMFSYPISTWWSGPWDLFIEHGHRLLGSLAGLSTLFLLASVWLTKQPMWVRHAALIALVLVVAQGALGGIRVLASDRQIAKIHGCVGPAFFAFIVGYWGTLIPSGSKPLAEVSAYGTRRLRFARFGAIIAGMAYLQLVVGAHMRHIAVDAPVGQFKHLVWVHIGLAIGVWLASIGLVLMSHRLDRSMKQWGILVAGLISLQVCLGIGTWCFKYGVPWWFNQSSQFAGFIVEAKSMWQANVVTAHVAMGSLIVASSVLLVVRAAKATAAEGADKRASIVKGSDRIVGQEVEPCLR